MHAPGLPRGGEIDLMEWVQGTPHEIYQTLHTQYNQETNGSTGETNPNRARNFDVTQYHVYAVDRTSESIIFYVDGNDMWRYANKHLSEDKMQFPFEKYEFDIILNHSIGGELNGQMTWPGRINDADLPGEMWVDWIKVTNL